VFWVEEMRLNLANKRIGSEFNPCSVPLDTPWTRQEKHSLLLPHTAPSLVRQWVEARQNNCNHPCGKKVESLENIFPITHKMSRREEKGANHQLGGGRVRCAEGTASSKALR
jgi:hypothetical protein